MTTNEDINWNHQATSIIKAMLARKNLKYHDLAKLLQAEGIDESQNSIANKLSRGTFSFTFVLQCMYVLRINKIDIEA